MQVDKFLFIPGEDIVHGISDDNQLIREIAETFKEYIDEVNAEEMDDSTEIFIVSTLKSLENVRLFCYKKTQMSR